MKHLFLPFLFLLLLSGCAKTQYYYVADGPAELYQMADEKSLVMADVMPRDTLMSWSKFKKQDGRYARVLHKSGSGWVRVSGYQYLYAVRVRPSSYGGVSTYRSAYTSSSLRPLDMSRPVHVRAHTRTLKSGKTINVRAHTRSSPGSGSSYRSSGSGYRSSGSSYRSSGSYRSSSSGSRGRH